MFITKAISVIDKSKLFRAITIIGDKLSAITIAYKLFREIPISAMLNIKNLMPNPTSHHWVFYLKKNIGRRELRIFRLL